MNSSETLPVWQGNYGPLQTLLDDPQISEIMVNGSKKIFVESSGLLKKTAITFKSNEELLSLMRKMAAGVGRELSDTNPCIDGRLADGSRIHCVIPPVAFDGPTLTIRKQNKSFLEPGELIKKGFWDDRLAYFLSTCVAARLNIVVSGGTGSGKTTLLNVLGGFIDPHERIITIEDTLELQLKQDNLVRLESQMPSENQRAMSSRELVRHALRMRPDRIIIGECRGTEAYDMLTAMNTGHEGSLTSLHSNGAREALRRLESMILLAATETPLKVIRQNIAAALHLIIQVQRSPEGKRRITEVIEVGGVEGDVILTQDIFKWVEGDKTHEGSFKASGIVPTFFRLIRERGIDIPKDFFSDRYKVTHKK